VPTDEPVPRVRPRPIEDGESRPLTLTGQTATDSAAPGGEVVANGGAVRRRLERKTAPERPLERGTGPERPVEGGTGRAELAVAPSEALTAPEAAILATPGVLARRSSRRLRARRVKRLVRHIEPWSVLKLALIFYFCLWVIMLVAGAILWRVAVSSGMIDNIEGFIASLFVLDNFKFNGDELFRAYAIGGLLMVLVATGFTVLATVLFNLISDLIGGVRVTVIQEETARPVDPRAGTG
jgi:hypothetical protein